MELNELEPTELIPTMSRPKWWGPAYLNPVDCTHTRGANANGQRPHASGTCTNVMGALALGHVGGHPLEWDPLVWNQLGLHHTDSGLVQRGPIESSVVGRSPINAQPTERHQTGTIDLGYVSPPPVEADW